jgi:hypothetical protein
MVDAFFIAAILSSIVSKGVVWNSFIAPEAVTAIDNATVFTLSGKCQNYYYILLAERKPETFDSSSQFLDYRAYSFFPILRVCYHISN